MIVYSTEAEIEKGALICLIGCSTLKPNDLVLPNEVLLPFHRDGRCGTKLRERTVAVCDWRLLLPPSEIIQVGGFVSTELRNEIFKLAQSIAES
jgi:hypothetical protein